MIVYVLAHERDGVMGVFRDAEVAKLRINSRPPNAWKWVEALRWWRNGDYRIQEETVQ